MTDAAATEVSTGSTAPEYQWEYLNKKTLSPRDFLTQVNDNLRSKDVLSVGEIHDLNQDNSFGWVQQFEGEILDAYGKYLVYRTQFKNRTPPPLAQLLPPQSHLLQKLNAEDRSFDALRKDHTTRLFALTVLPLARSAGYTDLVLEGFDEKNPSQSLEVSKDKTGSLLMMISAMMLGMDIHGTGFIGRSSPTETGDKLLSKIKAIKTARPNSRVIVYNGAGHNMTQPLSEEIKVRSDIGETLSFGKASYAPEAMKLWGDRYGAIDIFSGDNNSLTAHFKFMQEQASKDGITCYMHGKDQRTYIIN